ncbi:ras-specific guanine nucleotide-releasing factor RalGPS2-like isoform X2 [Strongylocentrotus purpuratus]|uniref:Ras-GEF domain-containing protein n=1 Tax=Strongylocentrotus purpuratus TaxID=7668 RepID=A0A7M7PPY1_STRPU|nr:ras-specific guanine nucleotide-releasing factor RalGPS2-like isoform X2 [Strongylocentrotus purpuratus]
MSLSHKPLRQLSVSNEDLHNGATNGKASGPRDKAGGPNNTNSKGRGSSQSESHTGTFTGTSSSSSNHSEKDPAIDSRWTLPRMKSYDRAVFDMLRVQPEEFATQITLLDIPAFKAITSEELSSCAWSGKSKNNLCPNIVAFSKRFNQVSFWVVHEVLITQMTKARAEVIGHFIKVAKKLFDINNLHATMAIISALHSASIFRLTKTWNLVHKKERATCEKLSELMTEDDNRQRLREYMDVVRLPCIPYLGMYLQDLIYIDVAHPSTGGIESNSRSTKMNNILRAISEFQQSQYDLENLPYVQKYLLSVRYIEELQKFVEEDNYKLSLQLEPTVLSKSKDDLDQTEVQTVSLFCTPPVLNLSNSSDSGGGGGVKTSSIGKSTPSTPVISSKFVPGHRKTKSLGANVPNHLAPAEPLSFPNTNFGNGPRHLLDDSLLEETTSSIRPSVSSSIEGSSEGSEFSDDQDVWLNNGSVTESCEDLVSSIIDIPQNLFTLNACLKRKPIRKAGRKLSVTSWTRFWVGLWGTNLVHYAAKSFNSIERAHFKSKPCKVFSISDWMVSMPETKHSNVILLTDPNTGNSYKYKAQSYSVACAWVRNLDEATKKKRGPKTPANLMSFE